ncbi:MAG: type VII secretion protein EccB [Pseudonocardiaceae bacterium]
MPSNPTTKSQVQAYRFMLRRVESALVRKDAVMLHEPMRHHLRASAVGLVLGVLGLAAFFVIGLFNSADQVEEGQIVAIEGTTSVFLIAQDQNEGDLRKVPVTSLTYARLLFAALKPGEGEAPETEYVEASALADITEAGRVGLDGAPTYLPEQENLVGGDWSVCDTADLGEGRLNAEARPPLSTTVIGGVPEPGDPLGPDQALLVEEESSQTRYLVWNGRRWEIDLGDSAVLLGYQLRDIVPRKVSAGLLNAIPEGNSLNPPDIPDAGQPSAFPQLPGVQVGEVIRREIPGTEDESFFLVRREGLEQVQTAVANLMSLVNNRTATFREIPARDFLAVPQFNSDDFNNFPDQVPRVLTTAETPIACLVWQGVDPAPVITFSADDTGLLGEGKRPVPVPNAVRGIQADRVFLESGKAALVHGVVPRQVTLGPIWLVIDQQRYGVPNIEVARALRLGEQPTPAPDSILTLLRPGLTLDPQDALEQYDPELAQQRQAGR